jgi:MMPL family
VTSMGSYLTKGGPVSRDGHAALLPVVMTSTDEDVLSDDAKTLVRSVRSVETPDGFRTYVTGTATLSNEFNEIVEEDVQSGESIGIVVALIVLVAVLGAVVAGIVIVSVRQASGLSPWAPEAVVTRRLGRRTEPAIQKISQLEPPRTWAWHAGGGLVRGGSGGRSEAWASSGRRYWVGGTRPPAVPEATLAATKEGTKRR